MRNNLVLIFDQEIDVSQHSEPGLGLIDPLKHGPDFYRHLDGGLSNDQHLKLKVFA